MGRKCLENPFFQFSLIKLRSILYGNQKMDESIQNVIKNQHEGEELAAPFDREKYEKHKSAVAIIMGHFFLRYLNLLYREFDGDLHHGTGGLQ
jgi:hypothetical protein